MPNIYDIEVNDADGNPVSLSRYKGQVLLIVNTASECGFTPQLEHLQQLQAMYHEQGFTVLAFPSNDFGKQEPLESPAVKHFCEARYRTTFPIFQKIHVRGRQIHPLYKYMLSHHQHGKFGWKTLWNFHKYLVDRNGNVVHFFFPMSNPMSTCVRKVIEQQLAESVSQQAMPGLI